MEPLSYLDIDRLALIPEKHWALHEFCFYLHDQLMNAAKDFEFSGAHLIVESLVREIIEENYSEIDEVDLFDLHLVKHHKG